jgi:nucleotide-binding universal stress UspA family protein
VIFRHLIVPLDGSQLAEAALPVAAHLARVLEAHVTLLHVIERDAPQEIHGQRHLADLDEAQAYLDQVTARAFSPETFVERHVHASEVSDVTESLVEHIQELNADLVVMCTHGRGGLQIRLFGSIPQHVLALGTTPVLLVHPAKRSHPAEFTCQKLLVPIDGNPDHEQGMPVAASLAQACQAHLHLVMVVPTLHTLAGERAATATLLPGATSAILDLDEHGAADYLQRQASSLESRGLAVSAEVHRGDAATLIVQAARHEKVDLIVVGTHGKSGMDAFWSNSLTPKIAASTHLPLLLVPVRSEK